VNDATSAPADEKSVSVNSALQESSAQIDDGDPERLRSAVARLTSNSTDKLLTLLSSLQEVQEFLRSEGERVQREVANYAQLHQNVASAATKIIAQTIGRKTTAGSGEEQNSGLRQASNARERIKRWPA
jgi:hypothetical protein